MYFKIMRICKSVLKYYNLISYSWFFSSRPLDPSLENWFLFSFFSFRSAHNQSSESHFNMSTTWENVFILFFFFFSGKGKEEKGREHGREETRRVIWCSYREVRSLGICKHIQNPKKKALEESLVSFFDRENTNQVTINEVSIRFKMLANSKTLA